MGNHRLRRWNVLVVLLKWVIQEKKRLICLIDWIAESRNSNHYFRLCELRLELFSAILQSKARGEFLCFTFLYMFFKSGLERPQNTLEVEKPGCCTTLEAQAGEMNRKQLKIKNMRLIMCLSWCKLCRGPSVCHQQAKEKPEASEPLIARRSLSGKKKKSRQSAAAVSFC